jgi:hypothetical protein
MFLVEQAHWYYEVGAAGAAAYLLGDCNHPLSAATCQLLCMVRLPFGLLVCSFSCCQMAMSHRALRVSSQDRCTAAL